MTDQNKSALLSKLRAPVAEPVATVMTCSRSDETGAMFMDAICEPGQHARPGDKLYLAAPVASAPVAGGDQEPVAWMLVGRFTNSDPKFTFADPADIYESAYVPVYAAPQASETQHPDDAAVDRFAVAMKAKLAKKRAEGRGGWDDRTRCSQEGLSSLLRQHLEKGDPVDVGNFAMMLHQRGERIIPYKDALQASEAVPSGIIDAARNAGFSFLRHADGSYTMQQTPRATAQASEAVRDAEDAERWRWATTVDDNAETLHSIMLCHGGDQRKINERADFYRAALFAQPGAQKNGGRDA